jgi:hypothetical protein
MYDSKEAGISAMSDQKAFLLKKNLLPFMTSTDYPLAAKLWKNLGSPQVEVHTYNQVFCITLTPAEER